MLPGWTGDTSVFHRNYPEFSKHFKVYVVDYRFQGLSDSPDYGMHVTRLAADLHELVEHLGLEKFNVLGHSMGNAVIWAYIMFYGQSKINKMVHEDEPPCLEADPAWSDEEDRQWTGGSLKGKSYWTLVDALNESWEKAFQVFGDYFPPHAQTPPLPDAFHYPEADPEPLNLLALDNKKHAVLLADHLSNDWRDVVKTIKVPTLLIAGRASHCSTEESIAWLHQNIADSQVVWFSAEEYGVHEMHLYSPEKFNRVVLDFLTA